MPKFNLGWLKDKNGEKFAPKTFIKQVISETGKSLQDILDRKISSPLSAKVGQQLIVKDVDENGKPIDWEYRNVEVQEQVQADYSQNDSTKPDYIKNKPTDLVKSTDYASSVKAGLVLVNNAYGLKMITNNLQIEGATTSEITDKTNVYKPIVPKQLDFAIKSGLVNNKESWTDEEKQAARELLGAISSDEIPTVAQADFAQDDESMPDFIKNRTHYEYFQGTHLTPSSEEEFRNYFNNCILIIVNGKKYKKDEFTKISSDNYTTVYGSIDGKYKVEFDMWYMRNHWVTPSDSVWEFILDGKDVVKQLDEKYIPDNIPKVSSASIGQTLEVEETDENGKPIKWKAVDKSEGEGTGLDVQINGESIVENGVANIPVGGDSKLGVFAVKQAEGTWYRDYNGYRAIQVMQASEESINNRVGYRAISPNRLDYAVKSAMCDGKGAEWTEEEKQAARERIGAGTGSDGGNTPFIDEEGYIVYGVENPSSTVYSKLEIDAMFESFLNGSEVAW